MIDSALRDNAVTAKPRIACIGGANIDRTARCAGEVVWGSSNPVRVEAAPGGVALNVATNLAALGCEVTFAGAIGRDAEGERLVASLARAGVDTSHTARPDLTTASYTALLDGSGELQVGLADMDIYQTLTIAHCAELARHLSEWPVWFVDANVPQDGLAALLQSSGGHRVFAAAVSPAKSRRLFPLFDRLDGVFANRAEASALTGRAVESEDDALAAARALCEAGVERAFVTMGELGAVGATAATAKRWPAPATKVRDVNGAGDGFAAGVIEALSRGAGLDDAMAQGLALASLVVEGDGAVPPGISARSVAARAARLEQPA